MRHRQSYTFVATPQQYILLYERYLTRWKQYYKSSAIFSILVKNFIMKYQILKIYLKKYTAQKNIYK